MRGKNFNFLCIFMGVLLGLSSFFCSCLTEVEFDAESEDSFQMSHSENGSLPTTTVFRKRYGGSDRDIGMMVEPTSDGYIILGNTYSYGAGSQDMYLIKTDKAGTEQWSRTIGGDKYDIGRSIDQTNDGGFFICGTTRRGSITTDCITVMKTDSLGMMEWSRRISPSGDDQGCSARQTTDGGYIILGISDAESDVYLIKIDEQGQNQWIQSFGYTRSGISSVRETSDGGFVFLSSSLVKTDALGNELWSRDYNAFLYEVEQTTDGGFILTGYRNIGMPKACIIKTDAYGVESWSTVIETSRDSFGGSIDLTMDGGFIMSGFMETGMSWGHFFLTKTDSTGSVEWTKSKVFGHSNSCPSVHQTNDSGYICCGNMKPFYESYDVLLIKTDEFGNDRLPRF